jgi:hypothetical protein
VLHSSASSPADFQPGRAIAGAKPHAPSFLRPKLAVALGCTVNTGTVIAQTGLRPP